MKAFKSKKDVIKAIDNTRNEFGMKITMLGMLGVIEDDPEMVDIIVKFYEDTIDLVKQALKTVKPKKKKS